MATHLTFPGTDGIWESNMPAAGIDTKSLTNVWKKTNEQQLFGRVKRLAKISLFESISAWNVISTY